jgi:CRISPR-associated endoribonuclease Cas6
MIELRVQLRLTAGRPPSGFTGLTTRAAFLGWVGDVKPALSTLLHGGYDATKRKRSFYSIKPVWAEPSGGHSFSVIFLEDSLAQDTLGALMQSPNRSLRIGEAMMEVTSLSIREVDMAAVGKRLGGLNSLDMRFRTPTYFSVKNSSFKVIQPNLTLLLTNIANTLHIARIESIPREKIKALRAKLGITGLDIRSVMTRDGSRVYPGFTGWVRLTAKGLDSEQASLLARLAEWAELLNVGGGRTAGFGVVEVSPPAKRAEPNQHA